MILSNIDCNYIGVYSENTQDVFDNPNSYNSVSITVTKNCCEEAVFTDTLNLDSLKTFSLQYPTVNTYTIKEVWVKNIVTGLRFQILSTTYDVLTTSCSDGTISAFTIDVANWFSTNTSTSVTQNSIYDAVTDTCLYTINNLPNNFVMEYMVVEQSGVTENIYYESQGSTSGEIFMNNGSIFIPLSTLASYSTFTKDGVYTVNVNYIKSDGTQIIEENCIFIDCEIKCIVGSKVDALLDKERNDDINIFLLHYTLVETSNCNCNCSKLCEIYNQLYEMLCDNKDCTQCNCE